jgi:hypothetical protein
MNRLPRQQKKNLDTNGSMCFRTDEVHALALQKIDLTICQSDLQIEKTFNEKILTEDHPPLQFYQKPMFEVVGFGVTVGVTTLIVGTHCFGLWK